MTDLHKDKLKAEKIDRKPIVVGRPGKHVADGGHDKHVDYNVYAKLLDKPYNHQAMFEIKGKLDRLTLERIISLGGIVKDEKILIDTDKADDLMKIFTL